MSNSQKTLWNKDSTLYDLIHQRRWPDTRVLLPEASTIQLNFSVPKEDGIPCNVLELACRKFVPIDIFEALLWKGSFELTSAHMYFALMSSEHGKLENEEELQFLEFFLKKGINPNDFIEGPRRRMTLFFLAVDRYPSIEVIQLFINYGGDPHLRSGQLGTPFMNAMQRGLPQESLYRLVLSNGNERRSRIDKFVTSVMDQVEMRYCGWCGKSPREGNRLLTCTGCESIRYCDAQCAKNHWSVHKPKCGKKGR